MATHESTPRPWVVPVLPLPWGSFSWGTHSSDVICSVVARIRVCFARQEWKQTAEITPGSKRSSRECGDAHTCVQGVAVPRNGTWLPSLSQDQVSPVCCLLRLWTGIPIAMATDNLSWVLSPTAPTFPSCHDPPMALLGPSEQHWKGTVKNDFGIE